MIVLEGSFILDNKVKCVNTLVFFKNIYFRKALGQIFPKTGYEKVESYTFRKALGQTFPKTGAFYDSGVTFLGGNKNNLRHHDTVAGRNRVLTQGGGSTTVRGDICI